MDALITVTFSYLCATAVWQSTRQRFGTLDEARTLAAVFAAVLITAGVTWILEAG